jgi:polysaccharide deacetylase family protein (PEP-CTERM system associated)
MIKSAFTIDVECGINISMRDYFKIDMPPTERVVSNTHSILRLLSKHQAVATFFILGDVAKHYPNLVKDIVADGHEAGVHSYAHHQLFKLTEEQAYDDTKLAKDVIENIISQPVYGFRAPAFSLLPKTAWALPMLAELGFMYDSSIMPAKTERYGWQGFPNEITRVQFQNNKFIIEFPLSTTGFFGKQIPACGGGYLRLFPYWFTERAFAATNKSLPVNLYLHPYETDTVKYPDYYFTEMAKLSLLRRMKLKTYRIGKDTVLNKLDRLLTRFSFDTMKNIIDDYAAGNKIGNASFENLVNKNFKPLGAVIK